MRIVRAVLAAILIPSLLCAQGLPLKDGTSSSLAKVNPKGALEVVDGQSSRATYIASSSALVTTAAYNLSIEAGASIGFKLVTICVGVTSATAAAGVTVAVQRRTTASTGGVALTSEGAGADSISRLDLADGTFPGIARRTGTLGTAGPMLDQWSFMVGEIGAGTADVGGVPVFCKSYGGATGEKPITVTSGVTSGVSINVTALGAGALAFGSISATVVAE